MSQFKLFELPIWMMIQQSRIPTVCGRRYGEELWIIDEEEVVAVCRRDERPRLCSSWKFS